MKSSKLKGKILRLSKSHETKLKKSHVVNKLEQEFNDLDKNSEILSTKTLNYKWSRILNPNRVNYIEIQTFNVDPDL